MKKKFTMIAVCLSCAIALLLIYKFYVMSTRNVIETLISGKRMINVLVAGSNSYHENRHNFYSIVSINPENGMIGLTFLPPSLRLDLSGRGSDYRKINEIDFSDFDDVSEALERQLKINIPFYVELYAVDVIRIVDLIEGVSIFKLDQVDNPHLRFGLNYFDGRRIVEYMNHSDGNSIFQKYDRVQDILLSIYHRKEKYEKMLNIPFVSELTKSLKTNIMPQEFVSLLKLVADYDAEIISTIVPGEFDDKQVYVVDEISHKIYEKEFLSKLVTQDKGMPSLKVKILNGTEVPGLARKMRNLLIREGLNVVEFGNSPYTYFKRSVIINQRGNIANVRDLAKMTGIQKVYNVIDNTQMHDVLIIIGRDFEK